MHRLNLAGRQVHIQHTDKLVLQSQLVCVPGDFERIEGILLVRMSQDKEQPEAKGSQ
jgi:hypothetical protein